MLKVEWSLWLSRLVVLHRLPPSHWHTAIDRAAVDRGPFLDIAEDALCAVYRIETLEHEAGLRWHHWMLTGEVAAFFRLIWSDTLFSQLDRVNYLSHVLSGGCVAGGFSIHAHLELMIIIGSTHSIANKLLNFDNVVFLLFQVGIINFIDFL